LTLRLRSGQATGTRLRFPHASWSEAPLIAIKPRWTGHSFRKCGMHSGSMVWPHGREAAKVSSP